jgi:hypothetical protein
LRPSFNNLTKCSCNMTDNGETKDDGQAGGVFQKVVISASDAFVESVSSMAGSAVEEGANRLNDFSIEVCRQNLDRMARERSVVTASEVVYVKDGVTMSTMIDAMLKACFLSLGEGGGNGTTWVVCAPTDQGKSVAAQFLIHGNHSLLPKRSLKIDATNMKNFAKDFAVYLKCSAAESCMSQLLCEALSDTAPRGDDGGTKVAKVSAAAIHVAGKYLCNPGNATGKGNLMEMRDAEQHKVLKLDTDGAEPALILIVDELYCDTEENKNFVRTLLRDASAKGIVVFLMTRDREWASKLIELNAGTKCKPLPYNVDNEGYDGSKRFTGIPKWNGLFWSVKELRQLVLPSCEKFHIDPETAIPDDSKLTPGEAKKIVMNIRWNEQLK